jgi:serine/threonine-protein kinase
VALDPSLIQQAMVEGRDREAPRDAAADAERRQRHGLQQPRPPANLFLTQGSDGAPVIKVLDFGISKLSVPDVSEASLTKTSTMMGSPYYMSPEQMKSARSVDHRADIWALGVILFELLAGTPPFAGETLPELIANIMTDAPLNLQKLRPEVPTGLEEVVAHCLQKDRDARFQTVHEFAEALGPYASRATAFTLERISKIATGTTRTSLPPAPSADAPAMAGTATNWADTQTNSQKRSSKIAVAAVAIAVVGASVGVGSWWALSRPTVKPEHALTAPEPKQENTEKAKPTTDPKKAAHGQVVPVVPERSGEGDEQQGEGDEQQGDDDASANEPNPKLPAKSVAKPAAKKPTASKPRDTLPAKQPAQTVKAAPPKPAETEPKVRRPKNPLAIELK